MTNRTSILLNWNTITTVFFLYNDFIVFKQEKNYDLLLIDWLTSIADFFPRKFHRKNLIEKTSRIFFTNMVYDNDDDKRKPDFHFVWQNMGGSERSRLDKNITLICIGFEPWNIQMLSRCLCVYVWEKRRLICGLLMDILKNVDLFVLNFFWISFF